MFLQITGLKSDIESLEDSLNKLKMEKKKGSLEAEELQSLLDMEKQKNNVLASELDLQKTDYDSICRTVD